MVLLLYYTPYAITTYINAFRLVPILFFSFLGVAMWLVRINGYLTCATSTYLYLYMQMPDSCAHHIPEMSSSRRFSLFPHFFKPK